MVPTSHMSAWYEQHPHLLDEVRRVVSEFPSLTVNIGSGVCVQGILDVNVGEISDFFSVEIEIPEGYPIEVPQVFEVGGRRRKTARKYRIPEQDLHYNPGAWSACLCHDAALHVYYHRDAPFTSFVKNLVQPFFYAQAYFDRFRRWPWGERSHGERGTYETYVELLGTRDLRSIRASLSLLAQPGSPSGHLSCVCGSGRRIRDCHPGILDALIRLKPSIPTCLAREHLSHVRRLGEGDVKRTRPISSLVNPEGMFGR